MKYLLSIIQLLVYGVVYSSSPDLKSWKNLASDVSFLKNSGQWPVEILYKGLSLSTNVYFLKNGISFSQRTDVNTNDDSDSISVWNMKFINANIKTKIEGQNEKESVYSFLSGRDPEKWVVHPKECERLNYKSIYENIDLQFYGNANHLEYDYVLHRGSNIQSIRAYYEGIKNLEINSTGDLKVTTELNIQIQKAPVAWQIISGIKYPVKVNYEIINDSTFGFTADAYNNSYDLIIDPLFQMVWCSYTKAVGASNNINYCFSNAMDRDGNVYLTGMVDGTFPTTPGAYSGPGTVDPEVFVAKFSSDGTTMLYGTFLPGNSSEHGTAIAVDDLGQAYVTGIVDLNITGITDFPSTSNAYQPTHDAGSDAFLTVLNSAGTGLVYSTFLGGSGSEAGYGIALGPSGVAYITGNTSIGNFPVKASASFPTGDKDVFVAKFDITQSGANSLIYSARIGGGSFSYCAGRGIAVDATGNVYLTGTVGGSFGTPTYPTTSGAYSTTYNTGQDGEIVFATKLSSSTPVSIIYSTFIGPGTGNAIAVDKLTGEAFIAGSTNTFTFPVTTGALQTTHAGNNGTDAFAVKLDATGSTLIYSTFLGGSMADVGTGIAINSIGEAYVSGIAQDLFPTSLGSFQPGNNGSYDFFVVNLNTTGTGYGCGGSTYVGGSSADYSGSFYDYPSPHISIMDHGGNNDTILISSTSHSQDFPTTPGVYGPIKVNGIADQPVFFKMTCATVSIAPETFFTSQINTTCAGALVDFTDSTLNNPVSWQWSFPGATPSTSTLQNPQGIIYPISGSYSVKLVSCNSFSCDSMTVAIQVTVPQPQSINLGNDTIICNGENIFISAPGGFSGYNWQFNGASVGNNQPSITASQQGAYSIVVFDSLGCVAVDTLRLVLSAPTITIVSDSVICNGDSILLVATPGYASYNWTINGNAFSTNINSVHASQQGTYVVSVSDSIGCSASDSTNAIGSNVLLVLINDTAICAGNNLSIDAGTVYASYEWKLNGLVVSNVRNVSANESGYYFLTVTNQDNCKASDSVEVTVHPMPVVETINDSSICIGDTITMTATGAANYIWSPADYLSSTNTPDPQSIPTENITYSVMGTDNNGCTNSDDVFIQIFEKPKAIFDYTLQLSCNGIQLKTENQTQNATHYIWNFGDGTTSSEEDPLHYYFSTLQDQTIQLIAFNGGCTDTAFAKNVSSEAVYDENFYVPNSFTPNGDELNNEFMIRSMNDCSYLNLQIFNRWGEIVHRSEGYDVTWDGKLNTEDAPEGVYVYVLKTSYGEKIGHVTLIR